MLNAKSKCTRDREKEKPDRCNIISFDYLFMLLALIVYRIFEHTHTRTFHLPQCYRLVICLVDQVAEMLQMHSH